MPICRTQFLALSDRLDAAQVKRDARAINGLAALQYEQGWLTDTERAIVAGRAEELDATLPALIPTQRGAL